MAKRRKDADPRYRHKGVDKEKVIELHRAGDSKYTIAEKMECSYSMVYRILQEYGFVGTKKKKKAPEAVIDKGKVGALYRAGWPLTEIAIDVNCEVKDLFPILREAAQ